MLKIGKGRRVAVAAAIELRGRRRVPKLLHPRRRGRCSSGSTAKRHLLHLTELVVRLRRRGQSTRVRCRPSTTEVLGLNEHLKLLCLPLLHLVRLLIARRRGRTAWRTAGKLVLGRRGKVAPRWRSLLLLPLKVRVGRGWATIGRCRERRGGRLSERGRGPDEGVEKLGGRCRRAGTTAGETGREGVHRTGRDVRLKRGGDITGLE